MRAWFSLASFVGGVMMLTTACATSEEWADWRAHTTHFASGEHATFSFANNRDGSNPQVSRSDIEAARTQSWWGKTITVNPDQIFQN